MIIKKSRLDFVKSAIWNDHQVTSWSGLIGSPKKESHIYDQQNFVPITWQFVYHTVVSWPICVSIHEQPRLKCQIRGPPWNRLAQEHNLEHSYAFQTLHHWVISSSTFQIFYHWNMFFKFKKIWVLSLLYRIRYES